MEAKRGIFFKESFLTMVFSISLTSKDQPLRDRQMDISTKQKSFNFYQPKGWSHQLPQPQTIAKEQTKNIN